MSGLDPVGVSAAAKAARDEMQNAGFHATLRDSDPWMTGWLCLNPACLTSWPADYTGTCCGEDRFLIRLTIQPPRAASQTSEVAA